jgi:putative serine protease PepD
LLVASDGDADENAIGTTQIAKVAASVAPSVVTISSTSQSAAGAGESVGTGIFLTAAGEILTNAHVVEGATKIQVRLYNETEPRAGKVLAADVGNDLALVKIEGTNLWWTIRFWARAPSISFRSGKPTWYFFDSGILSSTASG